MQIGHGKQGVLIGEYEGPRARSTDGNKVLGYIEPACDNPQWILWFTAKGDAILHSKRGSTGAVQDEPIKLKGSKSDKTKAQNILAKKPKA